MIKLTKAMIHKYKCIEDTQEFAVEPDITILVGMNESGNRQTISSSLPRSSDTKVATLSAPPTGTIVILSFKPVLFSTVKILEMRFR